MTNDELVEAVARLVTPWAFDLTPAHYRLEGPEQFKLTRAYAAQELAKDTARAAISTIYEAVQEPTEEMIANAVKQARESDSYEMSCADWFVADILKAAITASPLNGGK